MKTELEYYDIFPKVCRVGATTTITVKPLGGHGAFLDTALYKVRIFPLSETNLNDLEHPYPQYELYPHNGALQITHCFSGEGQYTMLIDPSDPEVKIPRRRTVYLRFYALKDDLYSLRPFRGDLHVHSIRSDGTEIPAIVAANYRKVGFDFLAITDHKIYEPSLEAIEAYRDVPIDLRLFTGEEVHPPQNNTHYIHFGGNASINTLIRDKPEQYKQEVAQLMEELDIPEGLNRAEYASCVWVCREIRRVGGLSIMVHPHWIQNHAYHVREEMAIYMLKSKPFDAFELIGGQTQAENQMQINLWQQIQSEGYRIPVVGSSDSHGTVNAKLFNQFKTVVLAESCDRDALIEAIQKQQVVALEQYTGETLPRLYGNYRYTSFVLFLLEDYFPLHDEHCFEEGRLMKDYVCGDTQAATLLQAMQGRCAALMEKTWG